MAIEITQRGKRWSETDGRDAVRDRSHDVCELCRHRAQHWCHREGRAQGGTWSPANGTHLCARCHAWCHAEVLLAQAAGLIVPSYADPALVPVWLDTAYGPGWWLLVITPDGDHDVVPAYPNTPPPPRPTLPAWTLAA